MATNSTKKKTGSKASGASNRKGTGSKSKKRTQRGNDRTNKLIIGIVLIVLGVFLFAATSFSGTGQFGEVIGGFLKGSFGLIGLIFPLYVILLGIVMVLDKNPKFRTGLFLLSLLAILMLCLINSGRFIAQNNIVFNAKDFYDKGMVLQSGGLFGMGLGSFLTKYIGKIGLYIISTVLLILSLVLLFINSPMKIYINSLLSKKHDLTISRYERRKEREARRAKEQEQEEILREKREKVRIIREENRERRIAAREKALEEGGNILSSLSNIHLFPENHKTLPETSEEVSHDIGPASSRYGIGLEEQRRTQEGYGLGYDDPSEDIFETLEPSREEIEISTRDFVTEAEEGPEPIAKVEPAPVYVETAPVIPEPSTEEIVEKKPTRRELQEATLTEEDFNKTKKTFKYKKPPIDLLSPAGPDANGSKSQAELSEMAEHLERILHSFNVDAKVINVTQGPSVTRYEIQPNIGERVNKIVNLADDIALNLRAKTIRIEAPIPGRPYVGIEVGNDSVNMVQIRSLIDSKEFKKSSSKISFVVGKDIAGKPVVADLKSMPHLLIAGSTGSGKSVCINSIITSILYKADPDEVKLVLIDPKVVELGDYNGIPHLLIPVVTDPTKAAAALNWSVAEMTKRYKMFADAHVRDLESYNEHAKLEGEEVLPQVVIIIDELADLMMAAHAQVEESICRLAQLARAAGMHLIVATQRPSVNVVTGLIKANIPSRIAFAVASQYDSKTILDMGGAEKLGGKGDMLYAPLGQGTPTRVQGTFISDKEIHNVIDFVKDQRPADYSNEVIETINKGDVSASGSDIEDELYEDAKTFVIIQQKASTSLLQRHFRIGYNRAANLIDALERNGIIGPADGAKPRQVLVSELPGEPISSEIVDEVEEEVSEYLEYSEAEETTDEEIPE